MEEEIKKMIGLTMTKIEGERGDDQLVFYSDNGRVFSFWHSQDCCENVRIEDICGDLNDLIGTPLLQADEETSDTDPEGYERAYPPESLTWTFYKFATIKSSVTVRWLGESNGYYSESVSFAEITP